MLGCSATGKKKLYMQLLVLVYVINYNHQAVFLLRAGSYTRSVSHVGQKSELSTLFAER